MSIIADYISALRQDGVQLWVENGQLRFRAKKGVLTAERIIQIRSKKDDVIAELIAPGDPHISTDQSCAHQRDRLQEATTFQQKWILRLLEKNPDWKTTLSHTFRLTGGLDAKALEASLDEVVKMHASLRTRFVSTEGSWRPLCEDVSDFRLRITPAAGNTDGERRQKAQQLIEAARTRELDRFTDPLMAAELIEAPAQEYFLVLIFSRVVTDCFGIGQVLRDLWILYSGKLKRASVTTSSGQARYRDYAIQQQATDAEWRQKHGSYWNQYLAGAQPIVWPEQSRSVVATINQTERLSSIEMSFGEPLSAQLREVSRRTQTLPALVMLTVYVSCVSAWCKQDDLLVPFMVAGRSAAHETIVGWFSHILYLRIRRRGDEKFTDLLKLVSNEFYRAAAFRQDSGRAATERPELLRGCLCQWSSWHPAEIADIHVDSRVTELGFKVAEVRYQNLEELINVPPDSVDVEMNFFDSAGGISALAICRTVRFAPSALGRLMRDLRSIAEQAVLNSEAEL